MPTTTPAPAPGRDTDALAQTLYRFFHCLDGFDYAGLLDCCTADFRWLRQGRWLAGPDQVLAALQSRSRSQRVAHLISNTFVVGTSARRVDASSELLDEVETESYMTAYRADLAAGATGPAQATQPYRVNRVACRFRRVGGHWLLSEQRLTPAFEFVAAGDARAATQPTTTGIAS